MATFTKSLRQPSTESDSSLIDQAAKAVETAGSTDPAVINENAQFEAEIARLKEKTAAEQAAANPDAGAPAEGDTGAGDAGASDSGSSAPAEPTDPASTGDNASATDPADGDNKPAEEGTQEEPAEVPEDSAEQAAQDVAAEPVDGDADLEAASNAEFTSEERKAAVESFHAVRAQYETMMRVHENGRIGQVHIGLCSATFGGAARRHQIENVSFATESGDSILSRMAEFIKQLIARMKAAFNSLYNWFRDFLRGYKASTGKYEANRQGVADRMKFLQGSGVTINETLLKGKTVKVNGLSNVYGGDVADVNKAIADLQRFATMAFGCVTSEEVMLRFGATMNLAEKSAAAGSGFVSGDIPVQPISSAAVFGSVGKLTKLGDSTYIRDNVDLKDDPDSSFLSVSNLLGGSKFTWTMEPNENLMKLQERAESIRRVDFKASRTVVNDFEVQALTPAQIDVFLNVADAFVKLADEVVDAMAPLAKQSEGLKNKSLQVLQAVAKHAQEETITEQESFVVASIVSSAADAHARFTIGTCAKLVDLLRRTADEITNWCVLSSKVIDEAAKTA